MVATAELGWKRQALLRISLVNTSSGLPPGCETRCLRLLLLQPGREGNDLWRDHEITMTQCEYSLD